MLGVAYARHLTTRPRLWYDKYSGKLFLTAKDGRGEGDVRIFLTIVFYIAVFLVALKLLHLLGCMLHRLRFVARLRRAVEKKGGSVTLLHFPLRSFFSRYDGEDILVRWRGETTALKFFPYFMKGKNVILQNEECLTVQKNLVLFGGGARAAGAPVSSKINDVSSIYRAKERAYSSSFSSSAKKKVMVFSPAPASMRAVQNGSATVLDNGVEIYHFSVYTAKGFAERQQR